jgi:DNA ligase-1
MAKQEFVQLAHTFKPGKQNIAGAFVSEKLDGERAIWDGGISRDVPASDVPYANTVKDFRLKEPPIATGLWSRTGKVIHAPGWFLDALPAFPLDGELYAGRKNWQQLSSIVSQQEPDERWHLVSYMVFDSPPWKQLFKPRTIKVRNEYEYHVLDHAGRWATDKRSQFLDSNGVKSHWTFELVLIFLKKRFAKLGQVSLVEQTELSFNPAEAEKQATEFARTVFEADGEGVMIRKRNGFWIPERSHDLLKFKPVLDAEAVVVGYYAGKETDKGSKLLGMMGALEVDYQGATFKLSGFTDAEREFTDSTDTQWCAEHPGERVPDWITNPTFPRGSLVTFTYRELSDDGVPKEARYLRKRND